MIKAAAALDFQGSHFSQDEFPDGVLEQMSAALFSDCLFPLRELSGIAMTPSALVRGHVREEEGGSMHCTNGGKRLSTATDIHVSSNAELCALLGIAMQAPFIDGFGIYFDTNRPMFHVDCGRGSKLQWIRTSKGKYVYFQNSPKQFWKALDKEML